MNSVFDHTDTIVAVSTPHGTGGIAVVRISGAEALPIVAKCWRGAALDTMPSHTAHLGRIVAADGNVLDEVVLTLFRAPHSFTGDDVVEIACHGSTWIQQQLVLTLVDAGCRAAAGGEFTRRAFANGRLDLAQAEAVADVIAANSAAAHRLAMNQMRGAFSGELSALRAKLLEFVSLLELELDFSEEDVTFADRSRLVDLATHIKDVIDRLAASFKAGNAIKNGVPVAIVGAPNVGKSTLLNVLLHDDRALVSDIAGTTRDVIEDTITIGGTLFRFIDTAGIRRTTDTIETLGIDRAMKKLGEAQLVLWLVDAQASDESVRQFAQQMEEQFAQKQVIAVLNKCDLATAAQVENLTRIIVSLPVEGIEAVSISAKQGEGIENLTRRLAERAALPAVDENALIVTNARHYQALQNASEALARAVNGLRDNLPADLVSQDIREVMHYLGEITGEITTHEILGEIFSHFCVGK